MAESFSDLQAKFTAFGNRLEGPALRKITDDVSFSAKKDAMKEAVEDLGADMKMSGWRLKFNVKYNLTSDGTSQILPTPSGPWSVLDSGRKVGTVAPKKKKGLRHMKTPWGWRTFSKANPMRLGSTRGKNTWKRAETVMERETPGRVAYHVQQSLKKVFR